MRYIRYISLIMILICGLSFSIPAFADAADTASQSNNLSIQQALDQAYKNNPELKKANLTVDQTRIQKEDAAEVVEFIPGAGLVMPEVQSVVNGYQLAEISYTTARKAAESAQYKVSMDVVNAYTSAVKNYNSMEVARINLAQAKEQMSARELAKSVGMVADFDYEQAKTSIQQLEEQYKYQKSQYDGSIASLRSVLGQSDSWTPNLTSKPVITSYKRNDLSLELSRGLSRSAAVWSAQAQMDMQKSKEAWIIQGTTSEMQQINSGLKSADYEQAKRDTQAQIQQLYFGIDSLEGQIAASQKAYETAKKNSELGELKFQLGMIPRVSTSGGESSYSLKHSLETAALNLESLKATLAQSKAQFAYLTGQTVYETADWK